MRNPSVSPSLPNRWAIAVAAFFVQPSLGSVYAWSVFLPHVIAIYHVPKLSANACAGYVRRVTHDEIADAIG